jgi:predicted small secreted protein
MKHKILAIASCLIVALSLSACTGMGSGSSIPSLENRITDIGNPNEEAELLATKGIYINREFEVRIDYPVRWQVEERSIHEAYFHSDKAEAITASFVELESGETFELFLAEVRGGDADLVEKDHPDFDRSVCADNELVGGMIAIECYYYRSDANGTFVMTFTGMSLTTGDAPSVEEFTLVGVANKDSSADGGSDLTPLDLVVEKTPDPTTTVHLIRPVMELKKNEFEKITLIKSEDE